MLIGIYHNWLCKFPGCIVMLVLDLKLQIMLFTNRNIMLYPCQWFGIFRSWNLRITSSCQLNSSSGSSMESRISCCILKSNWRPRRILFTVWINYLLPDVYHSSIQNKWFDELSTFDTCYFVFFAMQNILH